MSEPDPTPSTSRGTRRSGANAPRTPAAATDSARTRERRESTDTASSLTAPSVITNPDVARLYTPDYGGNLFTAPLSRKRETKRNSRFSPEVEPTTRQKQPAAEKSHESSEPVSYPPVRNVKDTVETFYASIKKTLKEKNFALPPRFGGQAADLYRQVHQKPKGPQPKAADEKAGPSTAARQPQRRHSSVAPTSTRAPKPALAELAALDFGNAIVPAAQRSSSIPPGVLDVDKLMRDIQEIQEKGGSEETEEDQPPRGRRKSKAGEAKKKLVAKIEEEARRVKQEVLSDQEEMQEEPDPVPVPQPSKGRRSRAALPAAASPSVVAPSSSASSSNGRTRSARETNAMESMDDGNEQQSRGRRLSAKGRTPVPKDTEAVTPVAKGRGRAKNVKMDAEEVSISEQPSTSAAPAADRSPSRKRARLSIPNAADSTETNKNEAPAAKRTDTRKSISSTPDGEETKEAAEEEEKNTSGKHRNRRTAAQLLQDSLSEEEKRKAAENADEEGHATRRRSFRGHIEGTAPAAAAASTTRVSPRVPKPPAVQPVGSPVANRLRATFDEEAEIAPAVSTSPIVPVTLINIDGVIEVGAETINEAGGSGVKPSTSSQNTTASQGMMDDESAADRSGYGDESIQEYAPEPAESADEGAATEGEEHASTSAAAASEVPVKRGRGRPPKPGSIPKAPKPKKDFEPVAPMVREKRTTALNSPRFQEFMMHETTKIAKRASAGAGMGTTPRTLAAAGVAFDLPAPRVRPPTPPPPEVKAAPGSALSIMRALKKTKLPSMRSPSPTPASSSHATRSREIAPEAPPIDAAEKEKSTPPGPSHKPAATHPPASGSTQKDELVNLEPAKDPKDDESSQKEGLISKNGTSSSQKEKTAPPSAVNWITFDNIRGNGAHIERGREILQDPVTGELQLGEASVPKEKPKKVESKKVKKEEPEEQKEKEEEPNTVETPPEPAVKKEEPDGGVHDLLAKWQGSREEIDQRRLEAGVPVRPPDLSASPIAARASTRRSINAPSRFGDYDLNYGEVRKRSATIGTHGNQPSPALPEATSSKKRSKKKEETAPAAVDGEWEQPSGSKKKNSPKKDLNQPPIKLKIKFGTNKSTTSSASTPTVAAVADEDYVPEGSEEPEDVFDFAVSPAAAASTTTPLPRKRDAKQKRQSKKAFAPKWKRRPVPHLGHIQLDNFVVESVTMVCAQAIDTMLAEVCADGIPKSTLSVKEQASEQSRLSVAKRRIMGVIGVPAAPGTPRPKLAPIPIPPREERSKRIRHAPQSKEYDNLTTGVVEPMNNPSFHTLAGLVDRKPPSERRRESRQEAAQKKASITVDLAEANEVETPVEKPKKEKKRDKEREKEKEVVVPKNKISYAELLRQKTYNMERMPGKVLNDPSDFFYREIFTDDLSEALPDANPFDVDIEAFAEPVPDDEKAMGSNVAVGVLAEEIAVKVLSLLPRPAPYPNEDDDDLDEDAEWMEEDMKRALAGHSPERRNRLEQVLQLINSQRMATLAVEGTKGAQDVLYNANVKHASRLKELYPVFSQFHVAETGWVHRSLLRLLPAHLLPIYIELIRFLRYMDSKLAAEVGRTLLDRGADAEWDALFEQEPKTDDDRTLPMLQGSQPPTAANSNELIALNPDATVDDVTATMEDLLKSIEKAEVEEAAAPSAASPDSDQGLVIDEEPQEHEKAAAAAEESTATPAVVPRIEEVAAVEEEVVAEIVKPDLNQLVAILSEVTEKKVREANTDTIHDSINPLLLGDVVPILIAPVFDIDDAPEDFLLKNRPYEYMFRLIRYATPNPERHKTIRPRIPAGEISVAEAMDAAVECVSAAVRAAVKNKGNGRVVLFGWGLSCYINLRVSQLCHGISCIINFAFPLRSPDGWRGTPDDDINLTYCPTLFIMGAEAPDFDPYQLLMLRMNMIQSPGALVLGSADAQLNISTLRLSRERITQKIAARMIVEQVIDFINLPANQLERAKLLPVQLNNIYFVEPAAMLKDTALAANTSSCKRPANLTTPSAGHSEAKLIDRRRMPPMKEDKRKRSRIEDQTTVAGRLASSIAASAAPIMKRSRTDDLPSTSYGTGPGRIGSGDYRFSHPGPSPLASPALNSPGLPAGYRMTSRPAILSHNNHHNQHYYHAAPSPMSGGASTSAAAAASSMLLQTATNRPANARAPSPRGPLDPASISLS